MKSPYFSQTDEVRAYDFETCNIQITIGKNTFPPSQFATSLIHHLEVNKGERIIDIGTGVGIIGIYAAKLGANVFGTDTSESAIKQAKTNAEINGVAADFSVGSYFGDYEGVFDVIVANLPQSIIPPNLSLGGELLGTVKGGEKGNEILIDFLKMARQHMNAKTKLYILINSLSYYLETFDCALENYSVSVKDLQKITIKGFQTSHQTEYFKLNEEGKVLIFKEGEDLKQLIYVLELKVK